MGLVCVSKLLASICDGREKRLEVVSLDPLLDVKSVVNFFYATTTVRKTCRLFYFRVCVQVAPEVSTLKIHVCVPIALKVSTSKIRVCVEVALKVSTLKIRVYV